MKREVRYQPRHRRMLATKSRPRVLKRTRSVVTALAMVFPMLSAINLSAVTASAAPPLPVCGDIATCVSMAEQLAQPVLGQPCDAAVVTDCVQPAILAVQNRLTSLAGTGPLSVVEQTLTNTLNISFFTSAEDMAAQAVNTLSACADGNDPTCNAVKGLALSIASTIVGEVQACESATSTSVCQELTTMVDSVVTTSLADIDQCVSGSSPSCNAVTQLAQTVASLATSFVSQCSSGSTSVPPVTVTIGSEPMPTCTSIVRLAEDTAALALGTAESCGTAGSDPCTQAVDAVVANAQLLAGAGYACLNSDNATCYTVNSAVEGSVEQAGLVPVDCLYNTATPCGSAVESADNTAADTEHGLLSTLVCPNLVNLCQTITSQTSVVVQTPGFYDPADGGSLADITLWDLVDPPTMPVSVDETVVNTDSTALGLTERTGDQCTPTWYYDVDKAYGYKKIFHHGHDYWSFNNDADQTGSVSEEDTSSHSLGVTISASAEVEAGVIISHVKATFSISGSATWSFSNKHTVSHPVAPHDLGHLGAGDVGWKTRGHYYHVNGTCLMDIDKGEVIAWEPYINTDGYWREPAGSTE